MAILQRLKQETLSLHEQIEQRVDVLQRLQSVAAYRGLLIAFYGYYAPLEHALGKFAWHALGLDWAERLKVPKLELDLQRLGVNPATVVRCGALPALPDSATALGCLYVVEGATLGGQIIQRELATRLQIVPENGGAFFYCYGDQVGPRWAIFRNAIAEFATTVDRENRIVAAAKDTFQKLDDWLAESLA